jgi:hypothetical protein
MIANQVDELRQVRSSADQRRGWLGQVARQAGDPLALPLQPSGCGTTMPSAETA